MKISGCGYQHNDLEVSEIIDLVDAQATEDSQGALIKQYTEHGVRLSVPLPLTVPFLLYNLVGEERQAFTKDHPPEVLNNLVLHVWRELWESMTPFFLEI